MKKAITAATMVGALALTGVSMAPAASATSASTGGAVGAGELTPRNEGGGGLTKATIAKKPVVNKFLNSKKSLRHKVAIVPFYSDTTPDPAVTQSMADNAEAFFEREIPGMTWKTTITKPVKVKNVCNRSDLISKAEKKSGLRWRDPSTHVVAYFPECNQTGSAVRADGRGWVKVGNPDASGQVLAHEIGHNFGAMHGNLLYCTAGDRAVSLSKNCRQDEYANFDDVMGGALSTNDVDEPVTLRRLGPVWQSGLTGRAATLKDGKADTVRLSSTGARGTQAAVLETKFGAMYLGAQPFDGSSVVVAEVITKDREGGAARLMLNEASNPVNTSPLASFDKNSPALAVGSSWVVPGTNTRITVVEADSAGATVRTSSADAPVVPIATVTNVVTDTSGESLVVRWTPVDGAIAYLVRLGDSVAVRVGAGATEASLKGVPWYLDLPMTITAVSVDGAESAPTAVPAPTFEER